MRNWPDIEAQIAALEAPESMGIPGHPGCAGYYQVLHGLCKKIDARRVLEIGVNRGAGMIAMTEAMNDGLYIGVDISLLAIPYDYKSLARLIPGVMFFEGDSRDDRMITKVRLYAPFDLIFIDGDHTYDAVKGDFDACLPMLADNGMMVLHDVDVTCHSGYEHVVGGSQRLWMEMIRQPSDRFHYVTCHNALPHGSSYSLGICLPHGMEIV